MSLVLNGDSYGSEQATWKIGDPDPHPDALLRRPLMIQASGKEAKEIVKWIEANCVSVAERNRRRNKK